MLGLSGANYHFEFTYCRAHPVVPAPTAEDLAVFYIEAPRRELVERRGEPAWFASGALGLRIAAVRRTASGEAEFRHCGVSFFLGC